MLKKDSRKKRQLLTLLATLVLFVLFSAGYVTLPVGAQSPAPQVKSAPKTLEADRDAQVRQVINSAVVNIKGASFPKIEPSATAKGTDFPSCCQPGDTMQQNNAARVDLETPYGYSKNKWYPEDGPQESLYSPPSSCWVITSFERYVESESGPQAISNVVIPGNYSYVSSSQYQSVLKDMRDYLFKLNILDKYKGDLDAQLSKVIESYKLYTYSLQASNSTVGQQVRLKGKGPFNGRSWYHGYFNLTLTCCPKEVQDENELRKKLKAWIDQTVKKIPIAVDNNLIKNPN